MADTDDTLETLSDAEAQAPRPKAPPIDSRFLYVDIVAMRAKQLRRGALSRLDADEWEIGHPVPHKAERVAMEEVKRGLVLYEVVEQKRPAE